MTHEKTHEDDDVDALRRFLESYDPNEDPEILAIKEEFRKTRRTVLLSLLPLSAVVAACIAVMVADAVYAYHRPSAIKNAVKNCQQMDRIIQSAHGHKEEEEQQYDARQEP